MPNIYLLCLCVAIISLGIAHIWFRIEFKVEIQELSKVSVIYGSVVVGIFTLLVSLLCGNAIVTQQLDGWHQAIIAVLFIMSVIVSYSDIHLRLAMTIPLIISMLVIVGIAFFAPTIAVSEILLQALYIITGGIVLNLLSVCILKKKCIGEADIMYLASVAMLLGANGACIVVCASSFIMLPIILAMSILAKFRKQETPSVVPYLPGLSLTTFLIIWYSIDPDFVEILEKINSLFY